ncbi:MAG: T9SS type A sorting domain-containing protein [bacterium]|nr:T9SS type A sorting domain-containing protein [bacterium]
MYPLLALLAILFTINVYAQRPLAEIDVTSHLAGFRAYYGQRDEWPRAHGFKPFKRYEWDVLQRAGADGTIPAGALMRGFEEMQRMPRHTLDEPWVPLGPNNHGGRTRTIRFHPNNPDIVFAGSVGGGLFRSDNAGESWYPITDALPNLAIGCFEISASDPNIMYLGTGEGYPNGDAIKGVGLFKSTDGGATWNSTFMDYAYSEGKSILKISVDPRDADIVLASNNDGLYRSTDGAEGFTLVRAGNVNELKRDPENPDVLLCGAGDSYGATNNGVYRSTDNGATWQGSSTGLPSAQQAGRFVISFCAGNPLVVYCGVSGTFNYNGSEMIGVYRSVDNGISWERMSSDDEESHYVSQGWYDMAIAANPNDAAMVLNAGLDIYRTVNGGEIWEQKSWWYHEYGAPTFSHADHHELVYHPTNANEVWNVNDGGIFVSYDNGDVWHEKNTDFATYQYYAMGNATLDTALAYGGTQDNGTSRYDGDNAWDLVFGGDGGYCVIDYTNDNRVYVEYQNGNRFRTDNAGGSWTDINGGITGDGPWVTPMVQDPFAPNTIYTTTNNGPASVWMSTNRGNGWTNLGPVGSSNQVLAASPALSGRLYLGSSADVLRYDAGDGSWVNVTGNLSGQYVTRVTPDPYDANTVYVTKSGFSGGHVWKSTTGGTTWTNITGNLPNVPFQDVIVDLNNSSTLYAGGDLGVFYTVDNGANWQIFGEGLPVVRIDDMDMQPQTGILRAATHGRGMWEIPTGSASLSMLYPNGSELLALGNTILLRWAGITYGGTVNLSMTRSYPGGAWENIALNTANDGEYSWIVTGPVTDHARFRIQHTTQIDLADTSNSDTRIAEPAIILLSPDGGETVLSATNDTIRYQKVLVDGPVSIELNRDFPNAPWEFLEESYGGTDYFVWRVQMPGGERCRVRVTSIDSPWLMDQSEADFVVRPPAMTLLTPNGGETLTINSPYGVTWTAAEYPGGYRILLNRTYPEGNWEMISAGTDNDGSYMWTPRGANSTTARLRLATVLDPSGTYMESAANFTLDGGTPASEHPLPTQFGVSEAYPNPFNPSTHITLELPAATHVSAIVTNQIGQTVATLLDAERDAGTYRLSFDGSAFASGLYFLRVTAARQTEIRKLTLLK